jgi:hypothetical protein
LILGQATDARKRPAAIGHSNSDHDLVGARSVVEAYLHSIEVAANESSVLMTERDVEDDAETAALFI